MKPLPLVILILSAACFLPHLERSYSIYAGAAVDWIESLTLLARLAICFFCIATLSAVVMVRGRA